MVVLLLGRGRTYRCTSVYMAEGKATFLTSSQDIQNQNWYSMRGA